MRILMKHQRRLGNGWSHGKPVGELPVLFLRRMRNVAEANDMTDMMRSISNKYDSVV
jgi:hypothetical protein